MRELPVLKYNDMWELMRLGEHFSLMGNVADDATLGIMLRIETMMKRIEVLGSDERRTVWIRMKAPQRRYREDDADKEGFYWFQLATAHYEDFHYLLMTNRCWQLVDLRSAHHVGAERKQEDVSAHVAKQLKAIEAYVRQVVDWVCEAPEEYNAYVESLMPYEKREGRIARAELNRICPSYKTFDHPEEVLRVLNEWKNIPITSYKEMTIRKYMHVWRVLYEGYYRKGDPNNNAFEGCSDEEVFEHNSKGREMDGWDLDSEADFEKWSWENQGYHCMEVIYAGVSLYPIRKNDDVEEDEDERVRVPQGEWYFSLGFGTSAFAQEAVHMIDAANKAGIGLVSGSAEELRRMVEEKDMVYITPLPSRYDSHEDCSEDMYLPGVGRDLTKRQRNQLIKAIQWDPVEKVWPMEKGGEQ